MLGQWFGQTVGKWWGYGLTQVINDWIVLARRRGRR